MYKTEILVNAKNAEEARIHMSEIINKESSEGWDFLNAVAVKKSIILTFKRNLQHKINDDINSGINDVKERFTKVVDAFKSK